MIIKENDLDILNVQKIQQLGKLLRENPEYLTAFTDAVKNRMNNKTAKKVSPHPKYDELRERLITFAKVAPSAKSLKCLSRKPKKR